MTPVQVNRELFTSEQRNLVTKTYQLHRGTKNCYKKVVVVATFSGQFPTTRVPTKFAIIKMWKKQ